MLSLIMGAVVEEMVASFQASASPDSTSAKLYAASRQATALRVRD